mmetsp:Transcript_33916/g.33443  ORF Transcript_33916/g.33443 Transcript_33916/m.33443 type:complete len:167 (-) Transcript_33916:57-557(-)
MKHHLEYKCYSADHIKWIFLVSLPTMVIWVLGVPLILLRVLIKNRKNLSETKMQRYFLILYQGFKEKTFYWEFINGLRKLVILLINSSLDRFSINYKILISVFLLSMFYYVQKGMKPYKSDHNNKIDLLSMTTATVTIYSGVIFSLESDVYKGFKTFTWILVASFN